MNVSASQREHALLEYLIRIRTRQSVCHGDHSEGVQLQLGLNI